MRYEEEEARTYELDDVFWCCCPIVVRVQFCHSPCVGSDANVQVTVALVL